MLHPQATPLEHQLYTFDELRWHLAKYRGKKLPSSTLRDWLSLLKSRPNEVGCYEPEDLKWLIRYCFWLKRGGSAKGFQIIQQKEMQNASR